MFLPGILFFQLKMMIYDEYDENYDESKWFQIHQVQDKTIGRFFVNK